MVQAIVGITVNRGVDPGQATLVRRRRRGRPELRPDRAPPALPQARHPGDRRGALGRRRAPLRPDRGVPRGALHALGLLRLRGNRGDLAGLQGRCRAFVAEAGGDPARGRIELGVEARYESQAWEIPVPLPASRVRGEDGLAALLERFHGVHRGLFAFDDRHSVIELVGWYARASVPVRDGAGFGRLREPASVGAELPSRQVWFSGHGVLETPVFRFEALPASAGGRGPAIVESPFTTVVVDPGARFRRGTTASLVIDP
ncbi:MAG: hypothetical protein R3C15_12680 [Thermoleophilia bacterium]